MMRIAKPIATFLIFNILFICLSQVVFTESLIVSLIEDSTYTVDGISAGEDESKTYNDIIWDGKQFITVGNKILSSDDGHTWNSCEIDSSGDTNFSLVHWNGSQYLALDSRGAVFISTDSHKWSKSAQIDWELTYQIAWSGSVYVIIGNGKTLYTSPDGISWTKRETGSDKRFYNVYWCRDSFYIGAEKGTIFTSKDGATWTENTINTESYISSIVSVENTLFAYDSKGKIFTAKNTGSWEYREEISIGLPPTDIVYAGNYYVGYMRYNETRTMVSKDGLAWDIDYRNSSSISSYAWNGAKTVAATRDGKIFEVKASIKNSSISYTPTDSTNGMSDMTFPVAEESKNVSNLDIGLRSNMNFKSCMLHGLTYAEGIYVAVGNYNIRTSIDGKTWKDRYKDIDYIFFDVVYGDRKFVAVGNNGVVGVSSDGVTWKYNCLKDKTTMLSVSYKDGIYVGRIIWSNIYLGRC